MKKASTALSLVFLMGSIFWPQTGIAAVHRVLVLDVGNGAREAKGVENEMGRIIRDEVGSSDAYSYVSPDELSQRWFARDKDESARIRDLAFEILAHSNAVMPMVYEKQREWPVELIIASGLEKTGKGLVLHSMIFNVDNGRYCAAADMVSSDAIKDQLRLQIKHLLDRGMELQKVEADREVDGLNSVVAYDLRTEDGRDFQVLMRCNAVRSSFDIEDVAIVSASADAGSMQSLRVRTREGRWVEFTGRYKDIRLTNVISSAEPPDAADDQKTQEILSIASRGGYILNFTLHWKGQQLKALRIDPSVNPYGELR